MFLYLTKFSSHFCRKRTMDEIKEMTREERTNLEKAYYIGI